MLNSAASPNQLKRYNYFLIIFSIFYMIISVISIQKWKTEGLVIANCVNMLTRIICSCKFIYNFFNSFPSLHFNFLENFPRIEIFIYFIIVGFITRSSNDIYLNAPFGLVPFITHVFVGVILLVGLFALVFFREKQYWRSLRHLLANKNK